MRKKERERIGRFLEKDRNYQNTSNVKGGHRGGLMKIDSFTNPSGDQLEHITIGGYSLQR